MFSSPQLVSAMIDAVILQDTKIVRLHCSALLGDLWAKEFRERAARASTQGGQNL